ncbi:MAG: GWxTD domain-containing protein, partial [Gemmatimonadetes bacterium]|nr:GWxTD domain-containing protein [Gemmatimonadota bacterium]
ARADRALIGFVSDAGTRTLHVRIVDLDTGEPVWMGKARDDVEWQWIYAQRDIGEIALGNLMAQLGFQEANRHGKMMRSDEWPLQVVFAPLHTSQKALVGGYERLIREGMIGDGLFDRLDMSQPIGARLSAAERMLLAHRADAILCGSLMATGKDNAINAVGVALRLIDTSSGRVLWAGSANGRRVWRKDRFDDLSQTIATELVAGLAKVKSGTQTDAWANQPEPQDGPGWVNRGMVALERGLLSDAEEAFLKAESFEGSAVLSYEGLGRVYARRPALRQRAISYFYRAIEADTTRADLYYQMASVYFDIGTSQCVDMASRAIAIDSTYSAPYQLLGDWFARDDFYALSQDNTTAAAYYTHYLSLEPDDVDAVTKLGAVLLRMEDQQAIARQILPFMKRHPEALDLLPVAAQWAYRAGDYERASEYWDRFLERIDAQTLALHVDPTPILSDAQRATYNALSKGEKQNFIDRFWMQKDLDPTTEVNERLQEHYQRVWMARQYFAGSAYPWDRRGEVYLRYGEPDYRSRSGRAPGVMSVAVQRVKDELYAQLYTRSPRGALVGTVFPVRSSRAMFADSFNLMGRNDADSHTMGDGYLPVTSGEDNSLVPWESWVYVTVGGGMEITFTDEMGSGHFNFAPIPLRQPIGMR